MMKKLSKTQFRDFESFIMLVSTARGFTAPEGINDDLPEALEQGYEQAVNELMEVKRICGVSRKDRREIRKWLMFKMRDQKFFDMVAASLLLPVAQYMQPFDKNVEAEVEAVRAAMSAPDFDEDTVTNAFWSGWLDAMDFLHEHGRLTNPDDVIDLFIIPTLVLPPMTKRLSDSA